MGEGRRGGEERREQWAGKEKGERRKEGRWRWREIEGKREVRQGNISPERNRRRLGSRKWRKRGKREGKREGKRKRREMEGEGRGGRGRGEKKEKARGKRMERGKEKWIG